MRWLATTILVIGSAHADPKHDAQAALERGVAAFRAGEFDEAASALAEAKALSPESPNPYRWLAKVEKERGNCKAALVDVEGFLARVDKDDKRVAEMIDLREKCVVELAESKPKPVPVEEPPPPVEEPTRWWLWGSLGAVGVAAIGVAVYFIVHDDPVQPVQLAPINCTAAGCS